MSALFVTETAAGLRGLYFDLNGPCQSVVELGEPDRLELSRERRYPFDLEATVRRSGVSPESYSSDAVLRDGR